MIRKTKFFSGKKIIALAIFFAVFFFGLVWAAIVPGGSEAPDEDQHVAMVVFLKNNQRIPVFDKEEGLIKTSFSPQLWTTKFRTGAYYSQAYNSPVSYLPFLIFDGSAGNAKPPMRAVSSFFIAFFAFFLFLALCNIGSKKIQDAAIVTLFIALIPQVIFSTGYVNIEPFALFASALAFYFLTAILAGKNRPKDFLWLGLSLGLLAFCKANYLILALFFGFIAIAAIITSKEKIKSILALILPLLVLDGWWWLRNIRLYRDPIIINFISKNLSAAAPSWFLPPGKGGYNILTILFQRDFTRNAFLGFFAALGRLDIFLPTVFYVLFYLIIILITIWALHSNKQNKKTILIVISILLLFLVNLLIFANKNLLDFSPQGRHLFPMLTPLAWILFLGLAKIKSRVPKIAVLVFSFSATIWSLGSVYLNYKARGASLRENVGFFSIPAVAAFLLVSVAAFVVLLFIIFKTGDNE